MDIAILGWGFAGVYCAKSVCRVLGQNSGLRVGLISEENYMVFQPMLPEVAGSSVSPRHVVNPLRLLCQRALVYRGRVESVNWPERSLVLNAGRFSGKARIEYGHRFDPHPRHAGTRVFDPERWRCDVFADHAAGPPGRGEPGATP